MVLSNVPTFMITLAFVMIRWFERNRRILNQMPVEYLKIFRIWKYVFLFISIDLMHLYVEIRCYIMFQCSLETAESDFEK